MLVLVVTCGSTANAQTRRRSIDFRNFTYPGIWQRGSFRLENGDLEVESRHCITTYSYQDVRYVDLTGDGIKEALVSVTDHTACGSSSLSEYYYIYALRSARPRLLWKFSTGSEAHGGLTNFHLRGRRLEFELYGDYRIRGAKVESVTDPKYFFDRSPEYYTRLAVAWNGHRFVTTKRQVLPFPYKTIDEYERSRVR
jgi:hypothetical protein